MLDRVKDNSEKVLRPAPPHLVDGYRRTRTWIREILPLLVNNPQDVYGRRQLATLSRRLEGSDPVWGFMKVFCE